MSAIAKDPLAVDVSIDFDFFVRENWEWDFGHDDTQLFASELIWDSRYATIDLHSETSQLKYADFEAKHLCSKLMDVLKPRGGRVHYLAWADSHSYAARFFLGNDDYGRPFAPAALLVNIDAHHDGWPKRMAMDEPQAENWALHVQRSWPETQFVQCYPKWKDPSIDGESAIKDVVTFHGWSPFVKGIRSMLPSGAYLRNVFICSSQSWVPPHHDNEFVKLVLAFAKRSIYAQEMQSIRKRSSPSPMEARNLRVKHNKLISSLKEIN